MPNRKCAAPLDLETIKPNTWLDVNDMAAWVRASPTTVYRMVRDGRVPKPVHHGPGMTRWKSDDVLDWYSKA